jgi:hypothetical protein
MCDHLQPAYPTQWTHFDLEDGGSTILVPTYRTTQCPKDYYHCCEDVNTYHYTERFTQKQLQIDNYKLSNNFPMKIKLCNTDPMPALFTPLPLPTHMLQCRLSCWLNITCSTTVWPVSSDRGKPISASSVTQLYSHLPSFVFIGKLLRDL